MSRRHRPKAGFWVRLLVVIVYPLVDVLFRPRYSRLDLVPPPGRPAIVVANHVSFVDTCVMARLVWQAGRIPRFLCRGDLFSVPVLGRILSGAGQIPVQRGTSDAARSLDAARAALNAGEVVLIYPEGTFTRDPAGWPMQGRTGIARLVLLCPDVPVVPVGQWGAQRRQGWRRLVPRRRVAAGRVGEPLDLSAFRGREPDADVLREITDTVMIAVRALVAELRGERPPETFYVPAGRRGRTDRRDIDRARRGRIRRNP